MVPVVLNQIEGHKLYIKRHTDVLLQPNNQGRAKRMSGIIYDARRIKAYEKIKNLGEYAGKTEEYINNLWTEIVMDSELMEEFMYYLDHHTLLDRMKCMGYGLTDLYVWNMRSFDLKRDSGKNTADCNKEALVLDTFRSMIEMKKNPEAYVEKLTSGMGMDKYIL